MMAIQILGQLGSQAALPGLEKLLDTEVNDIYTLREALVALSKIQGPRSRELLQQATGHPYLLVRHLAETLLKANAMFEKTTIILVRHGQTEWNRIERFWHLRQDTCAINVFEVNGEDFVLVSLNDTCHLQAKA